MESAPTVSSQTRVAAVVGDPVGHSLSPQIHNGWFSRLGLDWVYVALPVSGAGDRIVDSMRALSLAGLNVTMPHKEVVARTADRLTGSSQILGVANTLYWHGDEILATSTDGDGFVASLRADAGRDPSGLSFVVLGAGGAARGIVEALGRAGARSIVVVNRTAERAESAAGLAPVATVGDLEAAREADVIVNTTPVGMGDSNRSPLPEGLIGAAHLVVDIVYNPRLTPLLRQAEAAGASTLGGIGMLIRQAALSFELWTELAVPPGDVFPDGPGWALS